MLENLTAGLALTVIGMSLVFAVLILLAAAIVLLVKINDRFAARHPAAHPPAAHPPGHEAPLADGIDPDELAAIAMAVRLHQIVRRKQAAPAMRTHQPGTLPSRWLTAGRTHQNRSWHRRG